MSAQLAIIQDHSIFLKELQKEDASLIDYEIEIGSSELNVATELSDDEIRDCAWELAERIIQRRKLK